MVAKLIVFGRETIDTKVIAQKGIWPPEYPPARMGEKGAVGQCLLNA